MPRFSRLQKFSMPLVWTLPVHVGSGVVDDLMVELAIQAL